MNTTLETPKLAARRLSASALRDGYEPEALHEYTDEDGQARFYRIRCRRQRDGEKWIRPMHYDGTGFKLGEPAHAPEGRPLYRLHELTQVPTDDTVLVVEGESCADALAKRGLLATTSGAADSANGADWRPLAGKRVLIWPDFDLAGERYGNEVARVLTNLGARVEMIDVEALGLSAKGDAVDWLQANPGATAADVLALPQIKSTTSSIAVDLGSHSGTRSTHSAPEPLRRPIPAPEPYPLQELGPILGTAAKAIRRVIQAPDAICGASVLAAASLAVQGLADVCHHGRLYCLTLWMLSIAESGERKSAVDTEAMRGAREFEKDLVLDYESAHEDYRAKLAEWEARVECAKTKVKREGAGRGLRDALLEIGPQPVAPLIPKVTIADFTAEGIAKLLMAGRPSIGAFTDEAALVFGGHGMTKEAITRTAGTLCKIWDNGTLDRIRSTDGAVKLYGRRLAMHLMAQPVIAERALSDDILAGQGFLARCLLAWPESTAGHRPYVSENLRDDTALVHLADRLGYLHRLPLPCAEEDAQQLNPPALLLSMEAAEVWRKLHNNIEAGMAVGGRFATCKPWASKTPEQSLRIAGVLTLVEDPNARAINPGTLERAAEIALWHLNEAARLAGTAALSTEVRDAEALLNWCHENSKSLIYSRDVLRYGPARIRENERFKQAMGELERTGWASRIEGGAEIEGRHRRNVWRILPASEGC